MAKKSNAPAVDLDAKMEDEQVHNVQRLTQEEEKLLCECWVAVSENNQIRADQTDESFWGHAKWDAPDALDSDDHTEIFGPGARPRPTGKPRPAKKTKSETKESSEGSPSGSISESLSEDLTHTMQANSSAFEAKKEKELAYIECKELEFLMIDADARLKEDLESSTWRRRHGFKATSSLSSTTIGDADPIRTLRDYSKPSYEGYMNNIELLEGNNARSGRYWMRGEIVTITDSIKEPDELDVRMPLKEAEKENEAENRTENRTKNEPTKSAEKKLTQAEEEEAVEAPSSQPVGCYLKHKINEKLIEGLVKNHRFNDSLSTARVGKMKHKTYNLLPRGPVYEAILKKKITKKEDIKGNFEIPSEDVLVDIAGYVYPVDFVILDIKEDEKRPFILGTPFLTIAKAMIKFDKGTITLRSGKSKMSFHRITESLRKIKRMIKNDIKPISPTMTVNRLVLEWEERIKLHQEKEMETMVIFDEKKLGVGKWGNPLCPSSVRSRVRVWLRPGFAIKPVATSDATWIHSGDDAWQPELTSDTWRPDTWKPDTSPVACHVGLTFCHVAAFDSSSLQVAANDWWQLSERMIRGFQKYSMIG
uniref:Reverse transcriptase domain-containing protein n=1 Tax=Tanacetum cinerariifolium TaxID=118510 RepID=A0A6L2J745_TANCI|nr:hypothetical protein [Tanacetum cinerariifolium]